MQEAACDLTFKPLSLGPAFTPRWVWVALILSGLTRPSTVKHRGKSNNGITDDLDFLYADLGSSGHYHYGEHGLLFTSNWLVAC